MHPHEQLLRETYAAMARGDGRALHDVLTPGTVWVIPPGSKLSGRYTGPDEIFGFWKRVAQQTGGGLSLEVEDVLANDRRGVALVVVRGERQGRRLEERQVAVFELADGKILQGTFIYEDPAAYEAFWRD